MYGYIIIIVSICLVADVSASIVRSGGIVPGGFTPVRDTVGWREALSATEFIKTQTNNTDKTYRLTEAHVQVVAGLVYRLKIQIYRAAASVRPIHSCVAYVFFNLYDPSTAPIQHLTHRNLAGEPQCVPL